MQVISTVRLLDEFMKEWLEDPRFEADGRRAVVSGTAEWLILPLVVERLAYAGKPIVHRGVLFTLNPGGALCIEAATTADSVDWRLEEEHQQRVQQLRTMPYAEYL